MISHRVIRSRRKTLAIEIRPDGQVWVRAPLNTPQQTIDRALAEKSTWIEAKLQQLHTSLQQKPSHRYEPGEQYLYLGHPYTLQFSSRVRKIALHGQEIVLPESQRANARPALEAFFRAQARAFITLRVMLLSQTTGTKLVKLRISSARTRWGSCSSKGTLSFTWRLLMAPAPVIDYVIYHELAHLHEPNHSKAFWQLVASWQPNYKQYRAWLRREGIKLMALWDSP